MKRKFFTFTLVLLLSCFMATSAWAAQKIEFVSANTGGYIQKMNEHVDHGQSEISTIFGLSDSEKFTKVRETRDFNKVTHERYNQSYKGIPFWGMEIVVSKNHKGEVTRIDGAVALKIPDDIEDIPGTLDPKAALKRMQKEYKKKDAKATWFFTNEKSGTYIYINKKGKGILCYVVSFFVDNEKGNPSRPIYFIDVKKDKVIDSFDMLTYGQGTGPGGNQKIGQYEYGTDYSGFGVTVNGTTCTMNTTNVQTVDLNHGTYGFMAYSYNCYRNTHETINGGYCPLNDGQYFGQVIYDMYQSWYGLNVLPFQLTMNIHYGTNFENAFWDGSSMTFGDGYTRFYPLVCLDVSAHEVSHGFTEYNSNLIYYGESGGINEAFSDMAGEAAKYYMRGTNDFKVGYDIFKAADGALRYMYDPPLDGESIDHVDDFYPWMDVHYSSGIYNKAFYLIATSPGWTTRKAFDIFVKANTDYWTPSTTFQQGGEGAKQAAMDYGYDCGDVAAAFAQVGVNLTCPFTLNSPNGGESWGLNTTRNITWTHVGLSGNIRIELWKAGHKLGLIADNVFINNGSYAWRVGSYRLGIAPAGNDHKVKIITANGLYNDISKTEFAIVNVSLTVTSPQSKESLKLQTLKNITWTSVGLSGNVKLLLFKNGVQIGVIARGIPISNGSYTWTVGKISGGLAPTGSNYTVKVRSEDYPLYSSGSGIFNIL